MFIASFLPSFYLLLIRRNAPGITNKENDMELSKCDVNQIVFENILKTYEKQLVFVQSIDPYRCGYKNTDLCENVIAYDGREYLVIREYQLSTILNEECDNLYRQLIIRCSNTQTESIIKSVTGTKAWVYMIDLLKKFYSEEEIKERLNKFESDYNEDNAQFHYILSESNIKLTFENCYKFDINGAHHDALIEIFPKAKSKLIDLFNRRHENPNYKSYVNFFVGMLKRKGYAKTYNWIVQRTTDKLINGISECGGLLLYANTDGFIVQNPKKVIPYSKELGDFKLEYKGEVRFYRDINWFAYEIDTDNESKRITGNVRLSVRNKINLKENKIVHYLRLKKFLNNTDYIYETANIMEDTIHETI